MARSKVKLEMPSLAAQIDHLYAKERIGWRKTRLLAVKLAARGEHSAAEIADLCGISRGRFFEWLKQVRRGGLDELLSRQKPGPKPGLARGVAPGVLEELKQKLEAGEFNTAVQAQRWLEQTHGVSRSYRTVLRWLKKPEEC